MTPEEKAREIGVGEDCTCLPPTHRHPQWQLCDAHSAITVALTEANGEAEQLRAQLAGCGVAALGGTSPEHVAKPGDYGYSASYGYVLALRRKYDALTEATKPNPALLAVLAEYESMVEGIHGEFCTRGTWQDCQERCATSRALLLKLRKEMGL